MRALEQRGTTDLAEVEPAVRRIVNNVRRNGDRALRRYSARWDGLGKDEPVRVPETEMSEAWQKTPAELKDAITQAAENIRRYCEWQRPEEWQREIPLEFTLVSWCALWNRWVVMFPAVVIHCLRRC